MTQNKLICASLSVVPPLPFQVQVSFLALSLCEEVKSSQLKRTWLFVVPFPLLSKHEAIQTLCCLKKKKKESVHGPSVPFFPLFPWIFNQAIMVTDCSGENISISRGWGNVKTVGHCYANVKHF